MTDANVLRAGPPYGMTSAFVCKPMLECDRKRRVVGGRVPRLLSSDHFAVDGTRPQSGTKSIASCAGHPSSSAIRKAREKWPSAPAASLECGATAPGIDFEWNRATKETGSLHHRNAAAEFSPAC